MHPPSNAASRRKSGLGGSEWNASLKRWIAIGACLACHSLRAPLRIRIRKSDVAERCAESENLSQRGVYFATDLPLNKGASLDLLLEMPEEINGVPPAHWLCTGHVVRVVPPASWGEKQGVGVCSSTFTKCHARSARSGPWAPACAARFFP